MNGQLSVGLLPSVFRTIRVCKKKGCLVLSRNEERYRFSFQQGQIAGADLGGLDPAEFVGEACAWADGEYSFEEGEPQSPVPSLSIETGNLILAAVRSIDDPDVIRFSLGDLNRKVSPSSDPLLRMQNITLTPLDGYVLSRIDSAIRMADVIELIPAEAEDVLKSMLSLYCVGLIDIEGKPLTPLPAPTKVVPQEAPPASPPKAAPAPSLKPEAAPPTAPPPATPAATPLPPAPPRIDPPRVAPQASVRPTPAPPPVAPAAATPPKADPPPPAAAPAPPPPSLEERRKEILEMHEGLATRDHFQFLGIPHASSLAQVKEAYFKLAKRFHPDVHRGGEIADLAPQIEAIFIRLSDAYEILRDPQKRPAYESQLSSLESHKKAGQTSAGGAAASPAAPGAPSKEQEGRQHAENLRKAERYFEDEKYWDAIQLLEDLVLKADSTLKQRARLLLARAYGKNPKWIKRAEEQLQLIVAEEPRNIEALMALGALYQGQNLRTRALATYKKVVQIKPDHHEAQAAVAELGGEEPPPSSGGFMKKIFR